MWGYPQHPDRVNFEDPCRHGRVAETSKEKPITGQHSYVLQVDPGILDGLTRLIYYMLANGGQTSPPPRRYRQPFPLHVLPNPISPAKTLRTPFVTQLTFHLLIERLKKACPTGLLVRLRRNGDQASREGYRHGPRAQEPFPPNLVDDQVSPGELLPGLQTKKTPCRKRH